jgi:predicted outer membrane repeat protein
VGNSAEGDGGVIYGNSSVPVLTNCILTGNSAGKYGGAIRLFYDKPDPVILTNCLLTENSAGQRGGAYSSDGYSWGLSTIFTNCTFSRNSADIGGAVCGDGADDLTFENCILSGDLAPNGSEIALFEDSFASVSYSAVRGGTGAIYQEGGSRLYEGAGNIGVDPQFVVGPLGPYYLSQASSGQGSDSPCVDAGSDTATSFGLDSATTRTDQAGDTGIADMGYHYQIAGATQLTRIGLVSPSNESMLYSAPTFVWTANGGGRNSFAVDLALSLSGPFRSTPVIPGENSWTMPTAIWNKIPSRSFVYWRVRGADQDVMPLNIIYSKEIWWFYKP